MQDACVHIIRFNRSALSALLERKVKVRQCVSGFPIIGFG